MLLKTATRFTLRPPLFSVICPSSLAEANRLAFQAKAAAVMTAGALVLAPDQTWIEEGVQVEAGVVIEPNVYLAGATRLGPGVRIGMGAHLCDAQIGAGTIVKPYSVIDDAEIGRSVQIGPFAHIRSGTVLADEVRIGNFVETKKSWLGTGSKASHLAYLGDASIGEDCNIGAGTITCNYDGYNKHMTRIGNGVFVGSNSAIVAPVQLADDSYVAAGSTVTDDVPESGLAIGRARQVVKAGLAATLRQRARLLKDVKSSDS